MKKPKLIDGGFFEDNRGSISFVNDFKFDKIDRFYIITNSEENPIRAWQGHKLDEKNFYCLQGSFQISCVAIDDWANPSKSLKVEGFIISEKDPKILHIPAGYANAIEAIELNSKLISFSTLPLSQVADDDVRFEINTWKTNG